MITMLLQDSVRQKRGNTIAIFIVLAILIALGILLTLM